MERVMMPSVCCWTLGAPPGRHRVDTLAMQAAGHEDNQEAEWSARPDRGRGWQWSLKGSEWPGCPAVREDGRWIGRERRETEQVDWGLRKILFRDEQRSRIGHA